MRKAHPFRIALLALGALVVGLLGVGFGRQVWDRAHPVRLQAAASCPAFLAGAQLSRTSCSALRDVTGGSFGISGAKPCGCDGPGQNVWIGSESVTVGGAAWASCVARGPGLVVRQTPAGFVLHYQIPRGWTAFTRTYGERQGCWMVPNAQIDSANPERLLDRAQWPSL